MLADGDVVPCGREAIRLVGILSEQLRIVMADDEDLKAELFGCERNDLHEPRDQVRSQPAQFRTDHGRSG